MNESIKLATSALLLFGGIALSTAAQAPPNYHPMHPKPMAPSSTGAPPASATGPSAARASSPLKKTSAGEQFFIVASLDLQKSQLLLKYPTEVTLLVKATDQTKFVDDSGKPMKLSDLRAGDTVWLTSGASPDGTAAVKIRKGEMTVPDLHRYYLDYSEIK
jgi:hypothetical protein